MHSLKVGMWRFPLTAEVSERSILMKARGTGSFGGSLPPGDAAHNSDLGLLAGAAQGRTGMRGGRPETSNNSGQETGLQLPQLVYSG